MSNGAHPSWLSLIDERKSSLVKQGCDSSFAIGNEASFRAAFEEIPQVQRDSRRPKLLAGALRSTRNIRLFTGRLQHAAQPALNRDLTTLVWAATYQVIQAACAAKVKLAIILKLLNELNGEVPRFTEDLHRFRNDELAQQPLQNLFSLYIEIYISMISELSAHNPVLEFDADSMRMRIEETAKYLSDEKAHYDEVSPQAEEREAEARARQLDHDFIPEGHGFLPHGIGDTNSNAYNIRAQFDVQRHLGHGSFGDVTEVREITTGAVYARKHVYLRQGSSAAVTRRDVENEVKIMQRLHHDHIATISFFIKEPQAYSIMMRPVADCDLLIYLEQCIDRGHPVAMTKKIYPWFGCILHALAYAHQLDIKHRDIKPGNILIKGSDPYLADFGVAKDFSLQDMSASADYFVKESAEGFSRVPAHVAGPIKGIRL